MTTVSLPSRSLPSSYFCAPHRSITCCFVLFVCVTSVWWECISYRCLNVLTVHTYILEILIFASVVRSRIPVHHGTICAGRPWEQSSTCQWARPALCCCSHGTDCSAASLTSHSLDNPVSVVPWTSQLPIPASSMACADRHPCWVMDAASPALHSKSSSWLILLLLFWSWAKAGCKGKALLPYIHNEVTWHLSSIAGLTKIWGKIQSEKCLGSIITLLKPYHSPLPFSPTAAFWAKTAEAGGRGRRVKEWEAHSRETWGCERPWWPSWGLAWESTQGAVWKWNSKKRELHIWPGKCCLPS